MRLFVCTLIIMSGLSACSSRYTEIPDTNFRTYLKKEFPTAFNGDKLDTKHSDVTGFNKEMSLRDKDIASLEGIEFFKAITSLDCADNKLTKLDVSKNESLILLLCSNNRLEEINISGNDSLEIMSCYKNELDELDVSKNAALKILDCSRNNLTSLDVSENLELEGLNCANNKLTSLDVSKNTKIVALQYINNTMLEGVDMRGMRSVGFAAYILFSGPFSGNERSIGLDALAELKLHESVKSSSDIKTLKKERGAALTIETYSADKGSIDYVKTCADYDPRVNDGTGSCLKAP